MYSIWTLVNISILQFGLQVKFSDYAPEQKKKKEEDAEEVKMQKKKEGEGKEKRRKKKEIRYIIWVGVCVKVGGSWVAVK